jgi:hypothetical protein
MTEKTILSRVRRKPAAPGFPESHSRKLRHPERLPPAKRPEDSAGKVRPEIPAGACGPLPAATSIIKI